MGTLLLVSPHIGSTVTSSLPGATVARSVLGAFGSVFLLGYIAVSNFNGGLSANLQAVRLFYNIGNVGIFPQKISAWLMTLNTRQQVPYLSAIILAVPASVLALFYSLTTLITFTAVILGVIFVVIAVGSLVSRYTQKDLDRPFRIPLWPIPPIIVIVGAGYAIITQGIRNIVIVGVIVVLGVIYYVVFDRMHVTKPNIEDEAPTAPIP
jgi:amino acid transporter